MTIAVSPTPRSAPASDALVKEALRIGRDVAAKAAAAVDAESRFPHETFAALREAKLLSALVPVEYGGGGASLAEIAAMCEALGQYCASSAMVFAMHQIQVHCIVRHGIGTPYYDAYLRTLVAEQRLMASATTEVGVGGDVRTSLCYVDRTGDRFRIAKQAPVISYAEHADDILVTARRAADAPSSDQLIVLVDRRAASLKPISTWDTLGFRGTCSVGFALEFEGDAERILPIPYADISSRTMLPTSHIVWTSLWLGIATDAVRRARAYVRAEARKKPGTTPPGAMRLAELVPTFEAMRSTVHEAVREYERVALDPEALSAMGFAIRMNGLKLSISAQVVEIVQKAFLICGISGYRNDSPYSLGRHMRDAIGAGLMVNNDRILGNTANLLLVHKDDPDEVGIR